MTLDRFGRHEWAEGEESRYGVYIVYRQNGTARGWSDPVLWAATSLSGIGTALLQLRADGDLTPDDKVGVLDGYGTHGWLINPHGAGRRRP